MLQIWTDANIFSKISASNKMCTESECGSFFSFRFGNDFQRDRSPQDCCPPLWPGANQREAFQEHFYPLDLTNQNLDFTKSFFLLKQALQQLTLGSEVAESANNCCLSFHPYCLHYEKLIPSNASFLCWSSFSRYNNE